MKSKMYVYGRMAAGCAVVLLLGACDKNEPEGPLEEPLVIDAPVPAGASPVVDRNFQYLQGSGFGKSTAAIGYETSESTHHGAEGMLCATEEFEVSETYYNGVHNDTILFGYHDVAVNTTCPLNSGITADDKNVSKGYLIFSNKQARSGTAVPYLTLTGGGGKPIPRVSVLQFTLTGMEQDGDGLTLYSATAGGDYAPVATFKPEPDGSFYSLNIDAANVTFKFAPADNEKGYLCIHDLKIYNEGVPDGSALYAEDYFKTWEMTGYATPYPETINKAGTNLTVQPADYTRTVTYYAGVPVTYEIRNGANYPAGYNHHGDTSLVYGLTTGYVQLPPDGQLADGKRSSLTISAVPSVSLVEFWIAATGMSGQYQLYKSVNGGEYLLYDEVIITAYAGIGKYFRYFINQKNVSFRFMPKPGFTGTPKIYGVRIWSDGKP
ncbi:MAG: hypothetical protein LBS09_04265 [Bacteroidales bacterium]|jgi:hypothetical protein|nr:hypothetical protein [Bacteroidales bacterium]